jgi:HAD superfamily hydrolase (TIGR01490 family)
MNSIAFFDVDGTLLSGLSGYYTTLELIRRRIIKKRRLPLAIFYKIVASLHTGDVRKMYEVAIADMAGANYKDILQIGREVFEKDLKPKLYREALEKIQEHRQSGDRVVLISSGPTMAVKVIEEFVAADGSFSIGPVIQDNILQNRLMEPFVYREGKILAARQEAEKHGLTLETCFFYADTHHDIPLLSAVGNPNVVNPDRPLRKEALRRGWPILEFKHLLGDDRH